MTRAAAGVAIVLTLAGCGGADETKHDAQAVRTCLTDAGADTRSEVDLIAENGNAGAFEAELPNGDVATFAFENTSSQAEATKAAFQPFLEASAGEVERHGNLVVAWNQEPADASSELVSDCL